VTLAISAFVSIVLDNTTNLWFPSTGNIHTLGVTAFWDPSLQNQTTQIQWGTLYMGHSYNVTLYFQSTSNVPTFLEENTTNWTYINTNNFIVSGPTDNTTYMSLNWNYNNQTLNPNQTVEITLTLTTDYSADFTRFLTTNNITRFSMDIIIQANEEAS
jgi:hypothetical protein